MIGDWGLKKLLLVPTQIRQDQSKIKNPVFLGF